MLHLFLQIGFTTTVLQAAATAVGAGIVLGGFLAGAVGIARGWARQEIERRAVRYGYLGGVVAVALLVFDSATRYLV